MAEALAPGTEEAERKPVEAMAAARRGKKHASPRQRGKARRPKTQPVKKKVSAKRKTQAKPKPVLMKHRRNDSKDPTSLSSDDAKMLRELERINKYMTSTAKGIMSSLVKNLCRKVSAEAERLRREKKRTTIGVTEMRTALRSVMLPITCKRCIENTHKSGGSGFGTAP